VRFPVFSLNKERVHVSIILHCLDINYTRKERFCWKI